jgi:hypothetical protein
LPELLLAMRITASITVAAGSMFPEVRTETSLPHRVERRFSIGVGVFVTVVSFPFLVRYNVVV